MNFNRNSLMLAALLLAGCGDGSSYSSSGGSNNPPTPPGPTSLSFTPFIKAQIAQTSNTADPVEVNDVQFTFDESETAFDDVLQ